MYRRLLPLALATFAVGTDGFVIAGLLPAIADDLDVSVPTAGQLVTVFALTLAVAAPVLGWATSALDRRTALLLALGVFVVGNAATALATSYGAVMTARVVTAAGAGIIRGPWAPDRRRSSRSGAAGLGTLELMLETPPRHEEGGEASPSSNPSFRVRQAASLSSTDCSWDWHPRM